MPSEKIPHPSWIEIDLAQFKKNVNILKKHLGGTLLCLPVKANAYGHGLEMIGKSAEEAGCDYLAVAHLKEGILLRQAKVKIPILVLGAFHEDQISDLIHFNLEFSVGSKFKADLVAKKCQQANHSCTVHIEVDTGMQRTGIRVENAADLFQHMVSLECFVIKGVYSHLATANFPHESFALEQIAAFGSLFEIPLLNQAGLIRHIANSQGVCYFPSSYFDMVRPSLIAFGYSLENSPNTLANLYPCFSVKTKISYFKVVEKGKGISYGHSYTTSKQTRIVTIPIGYGDGYRRCLSNRSSVLIRGRRFSVVGNICMDQLMVDIGDSEAYVGDEVVLIGKQGEEEITVQEIADLAQTNLHEVLCFFNDRLPRIYV